MTNNKQDMAAFYTEEMAAFPGTALCPFRQSVIRLQLQQLLSSAFCLKDELREGERALPRSNILG